MNLPDDKTEKNAARGEAPTEEHAGEDESPASFRKDFCGKAQAAEQFRLNDADEACEDGTD